ncbi:MAG: lysophospholipid acyltransferase family protein [Bacteroidota bacterium]
MHKHLNLLYVGYVFITFIIWLPVVVLLHILFKLIPDEKRRLRLIYQVHRGWIGLWEILTRINMQVERHDRVDPKQTYMFVANHNNMLDVPVVGSCIQHPWKSLVKKEILDIPILGWIIGNISIPVNRCDRASRSRSLKGMVQSLNDGISILVFPEGTRNRTEQPLKQFHGGAFRVAIEAQVPIMPIVMTGIRQMQPVDTMEFYPGDIQMKFLEPIPTEGLSAADEGKIKEKVYRIIEAELLENDPFFQPKFGNPVHYPI